MCELTPKKVEELFFSCMYKEEELPDVGEPEGYVGVEGITMRIGFHPERIEAARPTVLKMLEEVPHQFFEGGGEEGGGWSFLQLCMREDGTQWTGMHETMEQFVVLAKALGLAEFPLPRDMWMVLPGGVPYITFRKEPKEEESEPSSDSPDGS